MQKWITVASFDSLYNAGVARSKLESEGILCFIKNETAASLQYPPMLDVELQVTNVDLEKSLRILTEVGVIKQQQENEKFVPNSFLKNFPIINRLPPEFRVYAFIGLVVLGILALVLWQVLKDGA